MEVISLIMTTFCVIMFSGGEDCSYSFVEVSNDTLVDQYYLSGGKTNYSEGSQKLLGFVDKDSKTMYLSQGLHITHILHEIKHVKCGIEFDRTGINHPDCYDKSGHFLYE